VSLPDVPYAEVAQIISAAEAYAAFDDFIAAGRTVELTALKAAGHRLVGAVLPAHDYIRAQRIRRIIADSFSKLAGQFDALIAPSLGALASAIDQDFEYGLPRASGRRPLNLAGVLSGTPTVSIINGLGEGRLPTGIQFAGAALRENVILDAARALEERTPHKHLRPKISTLAEGRALAHHPVEGSAV
jgi:aspartyl-tRNA(Asn)/glutamyl-tRNA(Gln) amidotransferase subunit A